MIKSHRSILARSRADQNSRNFEFLNFASAGGDNSTIVSLNLSPACMLASVIFGPESVRANFNFRYDRMPFTLWN